MLTNVRVLRPALGWLLLFAQLAASSTLPESVDAFVVRPVETVMEAQVELHRRGFSCGSIDGVMGNQTAAALGAFQRAHGLRETRQLDPETRERLLLTRPVLTTFAVDAAEIAHLRPVPPTWLEKSALPELGYGNALELIAERHRASPRSLQRLNPQLDWAALAGGTPVQVPDILPPAFDRKAVGLVIRLEARTLEAFGADGTLLAHFPVSIARKVEKRPLGELRVTVVIPDPNYTFDPALYPEAPEARDPGRRLILPPGPNNPVGVAWIGLNLPGYGIHGTPDPEKVGRTESHGCFRLANWDARSLLTLVTVGVPVFVEP